VDVTPASGSTADFRELALQVRAAGLLDRRRTYYVVKIGLTVATLAGGWAAFVLVGNSWAVLGVAVFLGAVFAQLGFIGHDAGHHQIFASRRANRLVGLVVGNALIGLNFGWWVPKHNAHHSHPNEIGRDPDVGSDLFGFFGDAVGQERKGLSRTLARWRAILFFPLMLLRSLGLHVGSVRQLFSRRDRGAIGEGLVVLVHAAAFLAVVSIVLNPLTAFAFVAVQQGVFSLYLGLSFAPNHKGMPVIPAGSRLDFAHRQVVSSRNVAGGAFLTFVLGGLDYQIEHHLFPSMPRPNLRRAQHLVKEFCATSDLAYCEVSFFDSFRRIIRHLRARPRVDPCAVRHHPEGSEVYVG
jgi:fatty acid desaturase